MINSFDFVTDGGLAVFEHFKLYLSIKPIHKIRDERTPSVSVCMVGNIILATDFGDMGMDGNPRRYNYLSLVKELTGLEGKERFEFIANLYNYSINLEGKKEYTPPKVLPKAPLKAKKEVDKSKLLSIVFGDFTDKEIAYIQDKTGSKDLHKDAVLKALRMLKIKPVRAYSYISKEGIERSFSEPEFVFGIELREDKCYRILNRKPNANIKSFTIPSVTPMRKLDKDWVYSLGLNQLNTNKEAILCAGEFDFLALYLRGYNCFTLGAELGNIPTFIAEQLEHVPKIKTLYDTDYHGVASSTKLAQNSKIERLELPKLEKQYYTLEKRKKPLHATKIVAKDKHNKRVLIEPSKLQSKPKKNDICDYLKQYGFDYDLKKLLNKDAVFCEFERYLGNNTELFSYTLNSPKNKNIVWQINTGAGKTTSALKYFRHYIKKKDANAVVLYCAPLQAIVKQVGNEFTDMQVVCEGETNANIASLHSDTITTYQSVKILFKRFKDANIQPYLIIDEFHELVKSAYQDTQELLNNFELCKKVVGLTATPEPFKELFENIDFYTNEKYNNFEFLHCKQIKHTKYNVSYQIIKNDQIIPKIADLVKGCKGNSLVFREKKNKDSKNNIYEIAEVLITQNQNSSALSGGLSVKEKQQNEVFKALTEEESLLEKQHLIATSVIQTGVSIKHNIAQVIYVANKYDLSSFIQAINRVRKTDINVHLLIIDSDSEKRKNESFDMNIIRKAKNAFHNEIKKRNELMKIASGLDSDLQEQIAKLPALANNMKYNNKISYSKHVKNYYIDYMRIAYESFDKHIKSISKECFLTAVQNFEGVALSSVNDKEANSKTQFDSLVYKEINSYQKSVLSEAIKSSQLRDCIYTHVYENTDSEALQYKIKQLQSEEQFAGLSTKYSELVSDSQYSKGLDLRITTLQKKILKARAKKQDYQNELNALQTVKTKITALQSKELIDCIDYNKEYAIKLINRLYELNKASANCITIENAIQIARSSDGVYGLFLKRLQHISVIEVEGYIIFDIELYKYKDKYVFDKLEQAKKDKAFIANPVQFESNFKSEQAFKAFKEVFFYKDTNELVTLNSLIGSFASQAYHDKFKNIDLEGLAKLLKVA